MGFLAASLDRIQKTAAEIIGGILQDAVCDH